MPILASDILTDIDLRYRNSFTPQQKSVWMNDEQNDIFNIFKIDIGPVNFPLQTGVQFYQYFDTTLNKPVWCKVSGNPCTWVDATGSTV